MTPWLDIARDNRRASSLLIAERHYRSAMSRAYYAAFAKIAHELLAIGVGMPPGREAPAHSKVRPLIEGRLTTMRPDKRIALSKIVGQLYTLRITADYRPADEVESADAREAAVLLKKVFEAF